MGKKTFSTSIRLGAGESRVVTQRAPKAPTAPAQRVIDPSESRRYVRRETGLALLAKSGKISAAQRAAGERYGTLFRMASIEDASSLKSGIDFSGGGATGQTKTFPGQYDYAAAEGAARAQAELANARSALFQHSGLVAALDVICGKQWTPAMVSQVRREQDEIVTGLRIALDGLIHYFKEVGASAAMRG